MSLVTAMIDFDCGETKLARRPQTLPLKKVTATLLTLLVLILRLAPAQQPVDAGHYKNDAPKEDAGQL